MTRAWPLQPGVPAAGHVTSGGSWHSGAIDNCLKCEDRPPRFPLASHTERMRYLHSIESAPGWQYVTLVGDARPRGQGWVVNSDAGDDGHSLGKEASGTVSRRTHWRRPR